MEIKKTKILIIIDLIITVTNRKKKTNFREFRLIVDFNHKENHGWF